MYFKHDRSNEKNILLKQIIYAVVLLNSFKFVYRELAGMRGSSFFFFYIYVNFLDLHRPAGRSPKYERRPPGPHV